MSDANPPNGKISGLATTWRLHLLAALWLPSVGVAAFGLSRFAPDGEAERGVVLAVIALGSYKLSEWAIDVLGKLVIERGAWRLLSLGNSSSPDGGPAFSRAVQTLYHSGRDAHFSKEHELHRDMSKIERHLKKIERRIDQAAQRYSDQDTAYASLTPRRHVSVPDMFDLSSVLSEGEFDDRELTGTVFEMPDGTFWQVSQSIGGSLRKAGSLDGVEGSKFVLLRRVGK